MEKILNGNQIGISNSDSELLIFRLMCVMLAPLIQN